MVAKSTKFFEKAPTSFPAHYNVGIAYLSLFFFRERDRPRFSRYQADNRYQEHSPCHMCVEKDL